MKDEDRKGKLFISLSGKVPDMLKIILTSLIFILVIGVLISQVPQVLFVPQTDMEQSQDSGSSNGSSNDSSNSLNNGLNNGSEDAGSGNVADIDPNAGTNRGSKTSTNTSGNIDIPGYGSITVPANQAEVEIIFENPISNAEKYYLTFELVLKNTNETLYKSKMVPPGQAISNETLSRPLSSGTYDAIVKVQPYYMDSLQPTNNANIETKLIVK